MPKKKVTVVDIKDTVNENDEVKDTVNEPIETIEPAIEEPVIEQPVIEEAVTEPKTEVKHDIKDKTPPVEDKIVRTNELIKCPKCDKLVTSNTLKYSHKKTCDGEDKPKPKPIKEVTVIPDIEEAPKLVRTISRIPTHSVVKEVAPIQVTPEMMREHRTQMREERIQMRSDKMNSLFTNSI